MQSHSLDEKETKKTLDSIKSILNGESQGALVFITVTQSDSAGAELSGIGIKHLHGEELSKAVYREMLASVEAMVHSQLQDPMSEEQFVRALGKEAQHGD